MLLSSLQAFDRVITDCSSGDGKSWAAEGLISACQLASKLSDADLALLGETWSRRSLLWQRHCAEVLDQARRPAAIDLLMDMVGRGALDVAIAALESLRNFDPALFGPEQTERLLAALCTILEGPIEPLHRVVLEAFLESLQVSAIE